MDNIFFNKLQESYNNKEINITTINWYSITKEDVPLEYLTRHSAFMFPISGKAEVLVDGKSFVAYPGKFIYITTNHRLKFNILSNEPYEYINFYHDTETNLLGEVDLKENAEKITSNLLNIVSLTGNPDLRSFFKNKVLVEEIFSIIFQNSPLDENSRKIKQIKNYIDNNYNTKIDFSDLSSMVGKSYSQVSYLFKKHYDIRPLEYLIVKRIEEAIVLLNENKLSISEISHYVGYEDPLYFSRLFKKHIGISPTDFKKNILNKK